MTIRRRVEEIDANGRRRVIVEEAPREMEDRHDAGVESREEVVHASRGPADVVRESIRSAAVMIGVAAFALLALLTFRFAFLLAGANPNNGFVDFIYDASGWLADPFEGIVGTSALDGGVFDPATVIAMAVVLTAALLIILALWAATSVPSAAVEHTATRESRYRAHTSHER